MDNVFLVLNNNLPWIWVAVTIVCIVIETLTMSLTTIWFAISAFLMVFVAFTPLPLPFQLLIFVVLSFLLLIFTRPVCMQKLKQKKIATNYERIIGQVAVVVQPITSLQKGAVKVNGMEWTASVRSEDKLEVGEKCIIKYIEGVTAYVEKI